MELSGEILSGYFFDKITGPQFISPAALRTLNQGLPEDTIYWINAADPISLCGTEVATDLPRRVPSNHLVYHGRRLVLVSERNAKSININVGPDDEYLAQYLCVIHHLAGRDFQPVGTVAVESINGVPARHSEYLGTLEAIFDLVRDYKGVYIQRQF